MSLHLFIEQVDVAAAQGNHQIAGLPMGAQVGFGIVKGGGCLLYTSRCV